MPFVGQPTCGLCFRITGNDNLPRESPVLVVLGVHRDDHRGEPSLPRPTAFSAFTVPPFLPRPTVVNYLPPRPTAVGPPRLTAFNRIHCAPPRCADRAPPRSTGFTAPHCGRPTAPHRVPLHPTAVTYRDSTVVHRGSPRWKFTVVHRSGTRWVTTNSSSRWGGGEKTTTLLPGSVPSLQAKTVPPKTRRMASLPSPEAVLTWPAWTAGCVDCLNTSPVWIGDHTCDETKYVPNVDCWTGI